MPLGFSLHQEEFMWTNFGDFNRTVALLDQVRSQMDRSFDDFAWTPVREGDRATGSWPLMRVYDRGEHFDLVVEVPGLTEKDFQITIVGEALTIQGERKTDAPAGYVAHRRERPAFSFSRSVSFPEKVDGEKTSARLREGVLTVTVAKAEEVKPRSIAVSVG